MRYASHHDRETRRKLSLSCRKAWTREKRALASITSKARQRRRGIAGEIVFSIVVDPGSSELSFFRTPTGHEDAWLGKIHVGCILASLPTFDGPLSFYVRLPGTNSSARLSRSRGEARIKIAEIVSAWLIKTRSRAEVEPTSQGIARE